MVINGNLEEKKIDKILLFYGKRQGKIKLPSPEGGGQICQKVQGLLGQLILAQTTGRNPGLRVR